MMKQKITAVFMLFFILISAAHSDEDLYGTWIPLQYNLGDKVLDLRGIMIITPNYLVANTTFDTDGDGVLEANANSGPIIVENNTIKLNQWMQLHWRQKDLEGNFLRVDIPEDIIYSIEGDRLIFNFPSGNKYISERAK